jgi:hypothetical protein
MVLMRILTLGIFLSYVAICAARTLHQPVRAGGGSVSQGTHPDSANGYEVRTGQHQGLWRLQSNNDLLSLDVSLY